jgi:hypothetical protein
VDRKSHCLAAILAFALATAACGTARDGPSPEAQPTPNVTTFEVGRFDDLPLFPRSDPLGPRNEKSGVIARSFVARGTTPEQVLDFYLRSLGDGWRLLKAPEKIGEGTYRGDWTSGNWQLRLSATEEPELDPDNASKDVTVQYSLTLTPLPQG